MFIGVDIGGTKCAVTLGDASGNILKKERFLTTTVNETVKNLIETAIKIKGEEKIDAIGVSCGGPLDEEKGIILSPPNLPGWDRIKIKDMLEEAIGAPCGVRNDANACAMAEWYFGAGKGTKNMVFMTFGTGLGAGLILNGKLYSGTNGNAGELGHIRLGEFGPAGFGKCGSFEGFCSGSGLEELGRAFVREALQRGEKVPFIKDNDIDAFEVKDMADWARKGDKTALKAFEFCGTKLGEGLSMVIDLLNPEKIIIGSVYARCEDLLAPFMHKVLEKEALDSSLSVCKVVPPLLMEEIGDKAALAVAMEVYDEIRS